MKCYRTEARAAGQRAHTPSSRVGLRRHSGTREQLLTIRVAEYELSPLRSENIELRRLLTKHQWSGLTPVGSLGACPECGGSEPPDGRGHRADCAVAAALAGRQLPTSR